VFERFTERARRAVVLAQGELKELGHQEFDVGHLLLALLTADADELAAVEPPVDLEPVRAVILEQLGPRRARLGPTGHIPFTVAARTAMEQSQRIALLDRRNYIDDYDLLLAVLGDPAIRTALTAAGVDPAALRSAALEAQQRRPQEDGEGIGRRRPTARPAAFTPTPRSGPLDRTPATRMPATHWPMTGPARSWTC